MPDLERFRVTENSTGSRPEIDRLRPFEFELNYL